MQGKLGKEKDLRVGEEHGPLEGMSLLQGQSSQPEDVNHAHYPNRKLQEETKSVWQIITQTIVDEIYGQRELFVIYIE